jgi:hypothetical protein
MKNSRDMGGKKYNSAPVSTGKKFQVLPHLCETAYDTDRYM